MKSVKKLDLSTEKLSYLMAFIVFLGSASSAFFSPDNRWMYWHFSRLGEGDTPSAYIFNATVILCALLMVELARRIRDDIWDTRNLFTNKSDLRSRANKLYMAFWGIAVCMTGIVIFPYDTHPNLHRLFGYSMLLVFIWIIVMAPRLIRKFPRHLTVWSYAFIAIVIALYGVHISTQLINLLILEVLIGSFFFLWIAIFTRALSKGK